MSLVTNLQNLATRIATESKAMRTLVNGNAADLSALDTTATSNLVAAINEVVAEVDAIVAGGVATDLESLTDVDLTAAATGHVLRHNGTLFVNVLGTDHFDAAGAAATAQAAAIAASQPLDSDLTAIAALTTTSYGRAVLELADQAALMGLVPAASETVAGKIELATQGETDTGTDDVRAITPLKLQTRLAAFGQPLDSDLTAIAALTTTSYGRAFLELADQAALTALVRTASETVTGVVELATAAETTTGTDGTRAVHPAGLKVELDKKAAITSLADIAFSGDAGDLTGTVPTAALPPLAITSVSVVASQVAMLALTAEEGDVAKRSDTGRTYFLAAADATELSNWIEVTAAGDVTSVAGRVGAVTLTKTDVGLANVDNTTDANKPVSTATQTALDGKQGLDATLTALAGVTVANNDVIVATGADAFTTLATGALGRALLADATAGDARTELSVYSQAEIGDPTTNFVTTFEAGLV